MVVHHLPNPPPRSRYHAVADAIADAGFPAYRYRQLLHAVFHRAVLDFASMHELPIRLRDLLTARFGPRITAVEPLATQRSPRATKTLLAAPRGGRIESVLLSYPAGWSSLCLSSQVGCGLGCTFCATGTMGLRRNLDADEITDQVLLAGARPDSVAFMGMGEPLANPHTLTAIDLLVDPAYFGFSPRRITVSTVGFLPGMRRLLDRHPGVVPTVSVHSPYPDQRRELIPLEDRYPLAECLDVLDEHAAHSNRRVYLAYLLIDGVNDSTAHADALARQILGYRRPDLLVLSVIPFNPAPGLPADYSTPSAEATTAFLRRVRSRGIRAVRRNQFGADIDAACGQLAARRPGFVGVEEILRADGDPRRRRGDAASSG
ncbi:radical SAM protein [Phytoactinopolyspora limicola]|uniref:radical SAM protein n=1 Tax=Phytoactinopolyspora limicola TaxID=2715536 RepID=UPI001409D36D|nr:radical SAM protein [Phytoactinopolyspora limicola]